MKVEVEKLSKSEVRLRIELAPDEVQPHVTGAVERLSARMNFPGFRPGKAPYDVVAKRVGEQEVWQEALEEIVTRSFGLAIKEHKLVTIGAPDISVEKLAPGNPVVYTATVALLPNVEIISYDNLNVAKKHTPVEDREVDRTLEELRKMVATTTPVDRPAQRGDRVELDIDMFLDKIPIDGGTNRNHPITLGEGHSVPGFEEQVTGMTKGQTKEFFLTFPKDYHAKNLAAKKAEFRVTLRTVAAVELPPLDDALAQRVAKLQTLAELKQRVRKDLEEQRLHKEEQDFEVALLDELVKRSTFGEIPELLVDNELNRMIGELRHDIEARGMKFPDYLASMKKDERALREELRQSALRRVKTALAIRTIAELEHIAVTSEEIDAEIQRVRAGVADKEQLSKMESEDFRHYVRTVLTNRKVLDGVKSKQGQR